MPGDDDAWSGFDTPPPGQTLDKLTPPKVPPIGGSRSSGNESLTEPAGASRPKPAAPVASKPSSTGAASASRPGDALPNPWTAKLDGKQEAAGAGMPEYPRTGKYIFAVGRAGSGKSTLQSHLLRYLLQGGDHMVALDAEFAAQTASFNSVLAKWENNWQVGVFPNATEVNRPREFKYHVTPLQEGKPPLDFGFVEISGEDFKDLQTAAEAGRHARLDESLNSFLANPLCEIAFLFVANGNDVGQDDSLFRLFLEYLETPRFAERDFKNQCTAVLVIANPELAIRRLERHWAEKLRANEVSPDDLTTISFAETFLPGATAKLKSWDSRRRSIILPFSVGRIETRHVDNVEIPVIGEASFRHAKALYNWLYYHFTGQRLGPNAARRYWRAFLKQLSGVVGG